MMDEWNESGIALAYLITFRTYGSWLHGDERGSVDMHGQNIYGTPKIAPDLELQNKRRENLGQNIVLLDPRQREAIEEAIKEVCGQRGYVLHAVNVRSNHVHAVITAQITPERLADALKAFSTKKLREKFLAGTNEKIWSRGRSRRYLWTPRQVSLAIEYVLYGQGDLPPELQNDSKSEPRTQ